MIRTSATSQTNWATRGALPLLLATALVCASPMALAEPEPTTGPNTTATPPARPLGGQSACGLIELVPPATHPIRKHPALRRAVTALTAAADNKKKNAEAFAQFAKALAPAWRDAAKAFERPAVDPRTDESYPFKTAPARAFLEAWVFAPIAPLRIGVDRFEPALEVGAMMAMAACRAGLVDEAIAVTRGASGDEAAPLRAFAALLLIEAGRRAEAIELAPTLGEAGFLAPWVRVELTDDPNEKRRLHALAGRQTQTPDQQLAWQIQAGRLP